MKLTFLALACTLGGLVACNDGARPPAQRPSTPVATTTTVPVVPARGTSPLWTPGPSTGEDPMPTTAAGIRTLGARSPETSTTTMAQIAAPVSGADDTKVETKPPPQETKKSLR